MISNKIELINALKKEYELNSLETFSLKGIKKYNNMFFRFNNNRIQCYFAMADLWKNANDVLADELLSAMLEERVSVCKSIGGVETPIIPKGLIKDLDVFYTTGKNEVVEMTVADDSIAKAVVDDYKDLSSIKTATTKAAKRKEVVISPTIEAVINERLAIRQQAEAFNAKLNSLHVSDEQVVDSSDSDGEDPVSFSA